MARRAGSAQPFRQAQPALTIHDFEIELRGEVGFLVEGHRDEVDDDTRKKCTGLCFLVHLTELIFTETSDRSFRRFLSNIPGESAYCGPAGVFRRKGLSGDPRCFTCADILFIDPICVW